MGETRAIGRKNVVSVAMLGSRHSILDFYNTITLNGVRQEKLAKNRRWKSPTGKV